MIVYALLICCGTVYNKIGPRLCRNLILGFDSRCQIYFTSMDERELCDTFVGYNAAMNLSKFSDLASDDELIATCTQMEHEFKTQTPAKRYELFAFFKNI